MNHWIVKFTDPPEMGEVRNRYFADHLAYLNARPDLFVEGTPLAMEEGAQPVGGLWIVQAKCREDIVAFIEGDPMYQAGHRSFEIFATGKRLSVD